MSGCQVLVPASYAFTACQASPLGMQVLNYAKYIGHRTSVLIGSDPCADMDTVAIVCGTSEIEYPWRDRIFRILNRDPQSNRTHDRTLHEYLGRHSWARHAKLKLVINPEFLTRTELIQPEQIGKLTKALRSICGRPDPCVVSERNFRQSQKRLSQESGKEGNLPL